MYWLISLLCWNVTIFSSFTTLSSLEKYAQTYPQFPKADNTNWLDPDYTTHHKNIQASWFDKFFAWLHLRDIVAWDAHEFKNLLLEVIAQQKKIYGSARNVITLACPDQSKIFVFGDMHGAFHSLIRDLTWFKEQGIINDNLKIIKPNHYMVFNGDAIDRGAYILNTLQTILLLMKANPDHVVYIRGNHEDHSLWMNYGLKRELEVRASFVSDEKTPLEHEINEFFDTLPLALFVTTPQDNTKAIRISHRSRDSTELTTAEDNLSIYLKERQQKEGIGVHLIEKKHRNNNDPSSNIIAIVETQPWRHEAKGVSGLTNLEQDNGAAAWTVLSSPIQAHQKSLDFFYDAFAEITIYNPIVQSTINIYNRDIRNPQDPFKKGNVYKIISGMMISNDPNQKAPEGSFTIGSSMALKKGVPILSERIKRGMSTRINEINQKGGIKNQHIRSVVYNDNYLPHLARPNIDQLINKEKTDVILLPTGTPTLESYDEYTKTGKVLVLFPITGAPEFRDPQFKTMVHFRGTYADEVSVLINYMIEVRSVRRFALFYQDDAFGEAPLAAARRVLKDKGITTWTEIPYVRGSTDFKTQAQKIHQAQPDAIGFFSTAQATREFIRLLGIDFLANKQLFGVSFLGEESFRRYIREQGLKVLFGAVVPNPNTSQLQIAKDYRKLMDEYKYPYDVFSFEAYIGTSILFDALEKIEPPFTKEKILKQLQSLKNYDLKGLPLTFNPKTQSLVPYVWIESDEDEEWVQKPATYALASTTTTSLITTTTVQPITTAVKSTDVVATTSDQKKEPDNKEIK